MNLAKFNGHNPNSKSAKAREAKQKLLTVGTISCCKCGSTRNTILKRKVKNKTQYICRDCYKKTPEGIASMQTYGHL